MTVRNLKKNFDIKVHEIQVLSKNGIYVSVFVVKKSTGEWDHYSWTPDCYGAEPYFGTFWDDQQSVDMALMEYIREEIWWNCPIQLAETSEVKLYDEMTKRFDDELKQTSVVHKKTTIEKIKDLFVKS